MGAVLVTVLTTAVSLPKISFADDNVSPPTLTPDGKGGFVLDDLVVIRRAGVDDVTLEKDGTFSLLTDDSSTVFSALNSGSGAAVNFDVAFAKNSIVMTADGQLILETIARALRLIGTEQPFGLIVKHSSKSGPAGRRSLTKGRADAVVRELTQRHGIKSELSVSFTNQGLAVKDVGMSQLLQFTIVNLGAESIAIQ